MQKIIISIIALLATVGIVYAATDIPITVPTAPGSGYVLLSTTTGKYNYVATSSLGIIGTSQWTTNGSDIYYNTGNVGIGTTSPSKLLHVYSGSSGQGTPNADSKFVLENSGNVAMNLLAPNANYSGIYFGFPAGSAQGGIGYTGTTFSGATPADTFFITTGNSSTPKLVISSTGNVGIGTTSPTAKLDIYGTAGSSDIFAISSSTNARLITVTAAGRVGVGTASPTAKFQVNTAVGGTITSMSTDSNARFTDTTSSAIGVGGAFTFMGNYTGSSATLAAGIKAMKTNGTAGQWGFDLALATRENGSSELTEAMRITSTRNIGIGTTTPSSQLTVATGDIYIASSTRGVILQDSVSGCYRFTSVAGVLTSASVTCP